VATLKGMAEIAAKLVGDQEALTHATTKLVHPLIVDPADLCDLRPEIPDIPAVREVTPLAEQITDLIKAEKPGLLETRGRKPKWKWDEAISGVWGQVWRGDAKPKKQADVEQLLRSWFIDSRSDAPANSEIRKRAEIIWRDMNQD
jgi:hypothetical protein